jgi:membrane protein involved in colicin uptake
MMRVIIKQADATRDIEKEPYSQAVKEVNAAFREPMDRLTKEHDDIKRRHTDYLQEKAAAEAARLAEIARQEREAQQKREAEAREAEERKRRAEKAARDRIAAQQEAERQARRAKEAADEAERQEAIAAKRRAENAAIDAQVAASTAAKNAGEARADIKDANREQTIASGQAARLGRRADKLEDMSEDSTTLSRTRGELGTVASLGKRWTYRVLDYDAIPIETLRPHLDTKAIDAAIFRLMKTGVRELDGVEFYQDEQGRVM